MSGLGPTVSDLTYVGRATTSDGRRVGTERWYCTLAGVCCRLGKDGQWRPVDVPR